MEKEFGEHEGCRLFGSVEVRRVAGRIHFSVHQSGLFDLLPQVRPGADGGTGCGRCPGYSTPDDLKAWQLCWPARRWGAHSRTSLRLGRARTGGAGC
jgi:hypothetical protein